MIATVHNSMSRWRPEYRRNRSSNEKFWFWPLNLLLIDRGSSCQEIIVACLVWHKQKDQRSGNMEVTERKRRGPQENGGKIGSGKLRRQEKLIATLRDK